MHLTGAPRTLTNWGQASVAKEQRSANRQLGGSASGLGWLPGTRIKSFVLGWFACQKW